MAGTALELRSARGLLALQKLPRVGPITALRAAIRAEAPIGVAGGDVDLESAFKWAEMVVVEHEQAGVEVIAFFDERYPRLLSELADPPPILYARGNLGLLRSDRLLAIVGTREPSRFGETAANEIAVCVATAGWGIVSGLAIGVDTLAHRAALRHGAPTVAILGNGLDRTYPTVNAALAEEIVSSGGAVISELPFGAPPIPRNLVARDRLQSGMSAAVVVAQTAAKGGAMHTARFAAEQGRPLFCPVPHEENGKSEGLRILLERPACELPDLVPAWKDARALCARLGSRPVAHSIERDTLDGFVGTLERLLVEPAFDEQQTLVIPEIDG